MQVNLNCIDHFPHIWWDADVQDICKTAYSDLFGLNFLNMNKHHRVVFTEKRKGKEPINNNLHMYHSFIIQSRKEAIQGLCIVLVFKEKSSFDYFMIQYCMAMCCKSFWLKFRNLTPDFIPSTLLAPGLFIYLKKAVIMLMHL